MIRLLFLTLAVIATSAGCAIRQSSTHISALSVSRVVTAHHGKCPPHVNRTFGERSARLFSTPIEYLPYHCMSHSESELLRNTCGGKKIGHNTVFVTFEHRQPVRFTQDGYEGVIHVHTFGEDWDESNHRATLYFAVTDFPKPPPPPGTPPSRYRGPELFGEFGASGDPLNIASDECPTS